MGGVGGFTFLSQGVDLFLKGALLGERTLSNYRYELNLLIKELGDVDLEELKLQTIYEYVKNSHHSKIVCYGIVIALKSLLKYLSSIDVACLDYTKIHMKEPQKKPIPHTKEENILKIIHSFNHRDILSLRNRAIVHTMYCTGCRAAELIIIQLSEINFDNRQILIHGKGDKDRTVFFTKACQKDIENYLAKRKDKCKYLFANCSNRHSDGGQITTSMLRKILTPFSISPHTIRKTTGRVFYKKTNHDIRAVQEYLGHSKITTTQKYTLVEQEELQELYDKTFGKNRKVVLEEYENNHLIYHFEGFVADGYPRSKMTEAMRQAANEYLKH